MKRIMRIAALVLALLLATILFAGCASTPTVDVIKSRGKLVMLTNAGFPPFEYVSEGAVCGVDVDIAREIAAELGVELEIQDMDFDGIIGAIKSGKGDLGIAGMSVTEERLKNVDFSVNYVDSKLVILVKDGNTEITGADTLSGKKIGVQSGTTSDVIATGVDGAEILRYKTFLDAATAMKSGKCDAVVVDEMTANEILAVNKDIVMLEEVLSTEQYAICMRKGNESLQEVVNTVLNRLLAEGKIDEYIANHMASGE
ncbi:MAG: transporter substrate-binding domain-containing protein [Clostridiales bacterium]|nr:transporter substrate-binding domain-containing protein [Clostridiales bacterium]